jgi:hypothetical protein
MTGVIDVRERPCSTCPCRKDVPSGIWDTETYQSLLKYDGDIPEQVDNRAFQLFHCHKTDQFLCAGWVAVVNQGEALALRINARRIAERVWTYISPVPLFDSFAEAVAHGLKDIEDPGADAIQKIHQILRFAGHRIKIGEKPGRVRTDRPDKK